MKTKRSRIFGVTRSSSKTNSCEKVHQTWISLQTLVDNGKWLRKERADLSIIKKVKASFDSPQPRGALPSQISENQKTLKASKKTLKSQQISKDYQQALSSPPGPIKKSSSPPTPSKKKTATQPIQMSDLHY